MSLRINHPTILNGLPQPSHLLLPVGAAILAYETTIKVAQKVGVLKSNQEKSYFLSVFAAGLFFSVSVKSAFRAQIAFATAVVSYILISLVPEVKAKRQSLPNYLRDLVEEAASKQEWSLCVDGEGFINAMEEALTHPEKKSLILIGEPGVGKTLRAENLAWRIHHRQIDADSSLASMKIYSLNLNLFLAGTKYVGELEERCAALIAFSEENPTSIFYVDEVHRIIGAGATMEKRSDMSNNLKDAMARGKLRLIGATTPHEHRTLMMQDTAFDRRWHQYRVAPPNRVECFAILQAKREFFQKSYLNLTITNEAIRAAIVLSELILNRFQPDKAQDVLIRACEIAVRNRRKEKKGDAEIAITDTHVRACFIGYCREKGFSLAIQSSAGRL